MSKGYSTVDIPRGSAFKAEIHGHIVIAFRAGIDEFGWIAVIPDEGTVHLHNSEIILLKELTF